MLWLVCIIGLPTVMMVTMPLAAGGEVARHPSCSIRMLGVLLHDLEGYGSRRGCGVGEEQVPWMDRLTKVLLLLSVVVVVGIAAIIPIDQQTNHRLLLLLMKLTPVHRRKPLCRNRISGSDDVRIRSRRERRVERMRSIALCLLHVP